MLVLYYSFVTVIANTIYPTLNDDKNKLFYTFCWHFCLIEMCLDMYIGTTVLTVKPVDCYSFQEADEENADGSGVIV